MDRDKKLPSLHREGLREGLIIPPEQDRIFLLPLLPHTGHEVNVGDITTQNQPTLPYFPSL